MNNLYKKHFPGLDELRGIACLMVLLNHFASYKEIYGIADRFTQLAFLDWGTSGLTLFFVLSGFLITYLLLFEQATKGDISVRKFYTRRILRLWPLYFIIVFLGHFVAVWATDFLDPRNTNEAVQQQFVGRTIFFMLLLPHIVYLKFEPASPTMAHTWSIGVEEQFYWIWPWLIKAFKKTMALVMIVMIILMFASEVVYFYFDSHKEMMGSSKFIQVLSKVNAYYYWSKAGYFSVGGLLAYCYINGKGIQKYICHPLTVVCGFLGAIIFTYWYKSFILSGILQACSYTILMGNIIWKGSPFNGWVAHSLSFVGKISYGVYMFHPLVLIGLLSAIRYWGLPVTGFFSNLSLFIIGISAVVLVASVSYRYIELPFLKRRSKYR